ncbi:MAG: amylosucrase [Methylicorpusculum sp.]|uniref:amylosucrase n=1 Tax=Methylicorpusculum sp. TaxID=2713644 RepID=UPI002715798F|nr:amylosucrase [Methylicorpusculum sp.]MDO8844267.1 amylosucrase [Methylicorpusculum sp.]MDO8939404.1 amylosucrase [Methylicorpusculum sp.]MDP2203960.1 amylosucrase [Methylicorpusculum sp.]MDP3531467.1 amylosucrase [Methylicorpusculum sp.]
MYEQISHSLLNQILDDLKPEIRSQDLRHFYTRLGANFYAIHNLFHHLYGRRDDFQAQMLKLVETLARQYIQRPDALKMLDIERENDHNWFLSQQWVGMALYSAGFADNLAGVADKTPYFQELGVNLVHIMPILECPTGKSDGGYAVSNFRQIDDRVGTLEDLQRVSSEFRKRDILLTLDVVLNHTSNEHQWAKRAIAGEQKYQDYYYMFDNREIPDMFEQSMPEIFPETAPGNFTWNETLQKWVMTVFNDYQWDLNYSNPTVFIEMLDVILFWINQGADVVRLDAVAFIWKKMGTICQNEREAHLLLQLMKDCCQVTAPGALFIAEAIVAPVEITKYFGEDAIIAKECEIAYNATLMALLWDALATRNCRLLYQGLKSLPDKLERATWLNYVRCHDDIGLGFDDNDVRQVDYEPNAHRRFLVDFYTGQFKDSIASGVPFMRNDKTGDARIAGSLASLVGLETAVKTGDQKAIDIALNKIILMHSMIFSFGGIPLLYYGDEIATFNDYSYLDQPDKANDSRWIHRPKIDWLRAESRNKQGTVEHGVFSALKKMIAIRKETSAFADFNNRQLVDTTNPHVFSFIRYDHNRPSERVLVICNFSEQPQRIEMAKLSAAGFGIYGQVYDLYSGKRPTQFDNQLVIQPCLFYWLSEF